MRHLRIMLAFGVAAFVLSTLVTSWAAEDVRNSKHNLSASRTVDNYVQSTTTEVCVFCHTPHGGDPGVAGGAAPLWNRTPTATLAGYTPYTSPNFDKAGTTPGTPKGVSLACLSCHDGSVAFDALINFPLSGSTNNIGLVKDTVRVDSGGFMKNDAGLAFPMLGKDLSNDHPISMEIPCTNDPQFSQICANLTNNGDKVTYITRDTGVYRANDSGKDDIRDRLRTYPTNGAGNYSIECASCHNPHENDSTRFLRHPSISTNNPKPSTISNTELNTNRNAGSLLCLSCHQK